jgi:hypothetical protein
MNLPEADEFSIEIYASNGQMVKGLSFNGVVGYNQVELSVLELNAGNYQLKVIYKGQSKIFSWVKG